MKQKIFKWPVIIVILIFLTVSSIAQNNGIEGSSLAINSDDKSSQYQDSLISDSLTEYLKIAIMNNPLVLQRYSEYKASLERVPQVGSLPDPELTAGVFLSPMELPMGNQVAELSLMQMFPWFGVLKNAKDEMSLMAKASYESFMDAKLQVMLDVQKTWYEMYRLSENIKISEENLQIFNTIEQLSLIRYRSGSIGNASGIQAPMNSGNQSSQTGPNNAVSGSGMNSMGGSTGTANVPQNQPMPQGTMKVNTGGLADLYRIRIEAGDLENEIALYRDQQNTLLSKFNSYLNRPSMTPVILPDTLYADSLSMDILMIRDSIRINNPMLKMITFEQQSLDARKEMNKRMGLPMVGVGLNYSVLSKSEMSETAKNGRDMIMPMVKMTLPVYRKKYRSMQNEASALKSASEMQYNTTLNNLTNEYYEAVQLYMDASRRLKLFKDQALLANKSLNILIGSFSGGLVPLSDLLALQQQLLTYELKKAEAVADFNTASAWLKKLSSKAYLM